MKRILCLALLAGWSLAAVAAAGEPSMCKSLCASEKQSCRQTVARKVDLDDGESLPLNHLERNPHARAAEHGDLPTAASRAPGQAAVQNRRIEGTAVCDQTYARCVRACGGPATAGSEVLTKQGQAKAARAADAAASPAH